jgi:hypothetical protein
VPPAGRNSEAYYAVRVLGAAITFREKIAEYAFAIPSCSLALALVLTGCESAQKVNSPVERVEVATPIKLTPKQIASVRSGLARRLHDDGIEGVTVGRALAGKTSSGVIVCGYLSGKQRAGEDVRDRPFHGVFLGLDNASGFIVTGTGGAEKETAETLDMCKRSGLDLAT